MSTTGTNTFTLTRDDLIKASLRILGVIGVGETPITEDYTNASQALNILIKAWVKMGIPLWTTQYMDVTTTAGTGSYQIGPSATGTGAIVASKPKRIVEAFLRDSNNNDTDLLVLSRQEYNLLGDKTSQGVPNQLYWDSQEPNGVLYVYNVPNDTYTIRLTIQRQFYDMTSSTDNFDFPEEWFQALKWGLAAELCAEYGVDINMIPYYEQKSRAYMIESSDYSQEDTSIFFTVSEH